MRLVVRNPTLEIPNIDHTSNFSRQPSWKYRNFFKPNLHHPIQQSNQHIQRYSERNDNTNSEQNIRIQTPLEFPTETTKFNIRLAIVVTVFEQKAEPNATCTVDRYLITGCEYQVLDQKGQQLNDSSIDQIFK